MMRAQGAPAPMRSFICKVASRCDLDCDYCYVYRHADQTWRQQPPFMSLDVARALGVRIREHCETHSLTVVDVIFHGGEPLLAGLAHLRLLCDLIRESAAVEVRFRMQTNGVRFDDAALRFCQEYGFLVGLSCDGPQAAFDRHRLDHRGRSQFASVLRALSLLSSPEGRPHWSGFLTVIDIANDPLSVYDFLRSYRPRSIELLLPLANHDHPPAGAETATTPHADWLLTIFELWYREQPNATLIRRFRDVIALLAGADNSSEEWGLQPVDFAVVETNGDLQVVDTLKTAFEGANHLGLNVARDGFDDMLRHPLVEERQCGAQMLCDTCKACSLVRVCAGGYYPHRYSSRNGFDNPSVYCHDLQKLVRTIHAVVSADVSALVARSRAASAS
jgi:uncharacterized protein